jgi:hypothetical protein
MQLMRPCLLQELVARRFSFVHSLAELPAESMHVQAATSQRAMMHYNLLAAAASAAAAAAASAWAGWAVTPLGGGGGGLAVVTLAT